MSATDIIERGATLKKEVAKLSRIVDGCPDPVEGSSAQTSIDLWLAAFEDSSRKTFPKVSEIVEDLAALRPLEYEEIRERVAKLGSLRVSVLDAEVERRRPKPEAESKAVVFEDPTPAPDPVDGAALLEHLSKWVSRYIVLPEGAADAVSAWCAATWFRDALYFAPILSILSATKRSGKSTLLDLVKMVTYRGFMTSGAGITPAILFRTNEKYHPAWLIDEAEKLSGDEGAKELIGLLNSGHKKGGTVFRCDPNTFEPTPYDAFGFRAVAAIGTLWDTILDRSIVIRMTRKTKEADVSRFSAREVEKEGKALASKIARWVMDNRQAVADAEPKTPRPQWLDDRACDNWTPLFAIGMVAGDGWLDRLFESAKDLQPSSDENEGRGEVLIRDIKEVFEKDGNPEFMSSVQLSEELNKLERSPWGDYGRGKGMSTRRLATMLKPFGVAPEHYRDGNGYRLNFFQDAFSRYISPLNPSPPSQVNNINELGGFQSFTEDGWRETILHGKKPNNSSSYDGSEGGEGLKPPSEGEGQETLDLEIKV